MKPETYIKLGLTISVLSCNGTDDNKTNKPNIIFILADDLGYMDVNYFATRMTGVTADKQYYETPNIDNMARQGIAFSQAYSCPACSPTRASLLTGKYASRLGFAFATWPAGTYYNQNINTPEGYYPHDIIHFGVNTGIPQALNNSTSNTALPTGQLIDKGRDVLTIGEALMQEGYHTAFIGKWHVGGFGAKGYQPYNNGFQALAYYDDGASEFFNWRETWNNKDKVWFPNMPQKEWTVGNAGEETGEEYLTDDLTEQAIRHLEKRSKIKKQPFFLYFSHFAIHQTTFYHQCQDMAKTSDIEYFENKSTKGWNGHYDPVYAGMIKGLDNSVGRILEKLKESGLEKNTLVIFSSDNGGIDSRYTNLHIATSNSPLKGGKLSVYEGGIRVPLIFHWKGKIKQGIWSQVPVDCNDIFPTLLEAAGKDVTQVYETLKTDGRSLVPLWKDLNNSQNVYERDTFIWHYPLNLVYTNPDDNLPLTPHSAIRVNNYKLIVDWYGRLKLFDINNDVSEENNLFRIMPEKSRELFTALCQWLDDNVEDRYMAHPNPDYDPEDELRNEPFINIYEAYKRGEDVVNLVPGQ